MSYYYLASAYSHPDSIRREERFKAVCHAAGFLMCNDYSIFSPIAHCHPIAKMHNLPMHFDYWNTYNRTMLQHARALFILTSDGWLTSAGVRGEIKLARIMKKETSLIVPNYVAAGGLVYTVDPIPVEELCERLQIGSKDTSNTQRTSKLQTNSTSGQELAPLPEPSEVKSG